MLIHLPDFGVNVMTANRFCGHTARKW